MALHQIQEALSQVRDLQRIVLQKQLFKGYSGRVRILVGTLALLAAAIMASEYFPRTTTSHIYGWGTVFTIGLLWNYGALFYWAVTKQRSKIQLSPVLDAFPSLFVGGVLTLTAIQIGQTDLLFGIWMCLFGLTCLATRHTFPRSYWTVGIFYITCGTGYLLSANPSFLNPWPMGLVFFVGEWWGGLIFHLSNKAQPAREAPHER
ncbi:MAG: hypothetical protein QGI83_09830 [Candidatus Latescibacteria bacterium]|jgi:hypothetical protein|nr:hypothetical protein [Candidatus Latescibacterota bacterium]